MDTTEESGRRKLGEYELIRHLGSGGFAEVKLHRHFSTDRLVAIKSVKRVAHTSGVNLGAFKELSAFAEIPSHPNVLNMYDAFAFAGQIHLVLEYCVTDLAAVARDRAITLNEADVKGFAAQLLDGLSAIHGARLLHADLKPDNVLVAPGGMLKLADFGHASRAPEPGTARYHRIVTVWYRAPELLAGARMYTPAVDMWAVGCILAELFLRCPLFPAPGSASTKEDEWERLQMGAIQRLLGTPIDPLTQGKTATTATGKSSSSGPGRPLAVPVPTDFSFNGAAWSAAGTVRTHAHCGPSEARASVTAAPTPRQHWPGCTSLPSYVEMESRPPQPWRSVLPPGTASDIALDLIAKLLVYDPARRLTVEEALAHPWFVSDPAPTPPSKLPLPAKVPMP